MLFFGNGVASRSHFEACWFLFNKRQKCSFNSSRDPPSASCQFWFVIRLYGGAEGAKIMAEEWCRRSQYFFDMWETKGNPSYVFSDADFAAYEPSDAFVELIPRLSTRARPRAEWLRQLRPRES